jgi:uncharacterized integral membrane protein
MPAKHFARLSGWFSMLRFFLHCPANQHILTQTLLILIYLLTAVGLTPGGSSTVHIYTQAIHKITQLTTLVEGFLGFETRAVKLKLTMNLTGREFERSA